MFVLAMAGVALLSPLAPAPVCVVPQSDSLQLSRVLGKTRPLVFCEPYDRPIRRTEPFQTSWIGQAGKPHLSVSARPGQFLTFQIAVLARTDIRSVKVVFRSLRGESQVLPGTLARCISLGGVDSRGNRFVKSLSVGRGRLQPLWCGWDIPKTARGRYRGTASLELSPGVREPIALDVMVEGPVDEDGGADRPEALTRLRWLDSTVGEQGGVTPPYVPVTVRGRTVHVLGRDLELGTNGLPSSIVSHFSSANTRIVGSGQEVLSGPIQFLVSERGRVQPLRAQLARIRHQSVEATWKSIGHAGAFQAEVTGKLDYTGSGQLSIKLRATRDLDLTDARLEIPFRPESALYSMGLNRQGGLRPPSQSWKWDVSRHQDCFWIGSLNRGLMIRLKDENYRRPLLNIYYAFRPLLMPDSWGNGGKGGVTVNDVSGTVLARAYCGPRAVKKGQVLSFLVDFYVTPFRTIDTDKQWRTRIVHPHPSRSPDPIESALQAANADVGPNMIDVHQATYFDPYINYPYSPDSFDALVGLSKRAHAKHVRLRVYYTTREITQNMPELFALHSLNGEVVFPGPGKDAKTLINPNGPDPWLVQNLGSDFIPAWVDHVGGKYAQDDISVITAPDSRWNNFYLEGLRWMVKKAQIDGVYIDDTALDARSLRRARRILSARADPFIDLHSWNHFNQYAGYANNLNLYMEVLPYLDRLWLGEGFSANDAPWDYWLVEMSGLPFGLMSEMLDSPNVYRGLVFGETGRLGWSGDPRPEWKLFDQAGLLGTEMIPFASHDCPVRTSDSRVLATVYRGKGRALVAIASWADQPVHVKLSIDWSQLALAPERARAFAPEISGLQSAGDFDVRQTLEIAPKSGYVFVVRDSGEQKSTPVGHRGTAP